MTVWGDGGDGRSASKAASGTPCNLVRYRWRPSEKLTNCVRLTSARRGWRMTKKWRVLKDCRGSSGAYRPEKLRCGLVTDKTSERASRATYLREIAFGSGGLLLATFFRVFLAKQNVTLARKLTEARKHRAARRGSSRRRCIGALSGPHCEGGRGSGQLRAAAHGRVPGRFAEASSGGCQLRRGSPRGDGGGRLTMLRRAGVLGGLVYWADTRGASCVLLFAGHCRHAPGCYVRSARPAHSRCQAQANARSKAAAAIARHQM